MTGRYRDGVSDSTTPLDLDGTPEDRCYFRQLLAGRDFAVGDPVASQMVNFSYLVGDRETGECVVVDPAYAVGDLVDAAAADGMRVTGALVTHYHPDHCGGSMMGMRIEGAAELMELVDVPVHVQADEAEWVLKVTDLDRRNLVTHGAGDVVRVGEVPIELIHTPGHTPGSQCFGVDHALVSGDTLFLDGCGRTDFPGGDPAQMYESLTQRLATIPDDWVLYPGHFYAELPSLGMGATRERNVVFKPRSLDDWLRFFG